MEATANVPAPEFFNNYPLKDTKYDFGRDLIGYGEDSMDPQWPNGAKIAVSFVLNYEEGAERSMTIGDAGTEHTMFTGLPGGALNYRAFEVESEYDYGSRSGVWRIARLFKKHNYPMSIWAVGHAFELNQPLVDALVRDGHEIASHAYRWIPYSEVTPEVEKAYIKKQLESIKKTSGVYPHGWYYGRQSTHSLALLYETYKECGVELKYVSDAYADDIPYWMDVPAEKSLPKEERKGMLMVPYSLDCNDYRLLNSNGFRSAGAFYEHLSNAFDVLYDEGGKMMTIALHCRIMGKPGYFRALQDFVEYISSKPDVWVPTRSEIADHFKSKFPYQPKD
ncbi:carbohydrate esterase family 4 protein [[Candida] arabinofermentans NRRL YB-2248]|uniref:Carbohydrate esterase family 4 protein n=1 Tax=[Candida] arabinofermentans NRRL YB-2248 TaxID=983967 RepID=A0A1E4SXD3_9ASCO|nr:carbohydrate esterase family 4 protein [[Candida] arabinofermentans NRRL YB-2248]